MPALGFELRMHTATGSELESLERMSALLRTGAAAFDPTSYAPGHFTASAFVLSPERDAFLLLLHPKLQRWLQPGGHVEPSDASLSAAARREVEEETGLGAADLQGSDTVFDLDIHPIPARGEQPEHLHFDVRFLFVAKSTALPQSNEKLTLRWTPLAEASSLADTSVARVARKVLGS